MVTKEHLRCAQESESKANDKTSEVVTKLEGLHKNMQKIAREKDSTIFMSVSQMSVGVLLHGTPY